MWQWMKIITMGNTFSVEIEEKNDRDRSSKATQGEKLAFIFKESLAWLLNSFLTSLFSSIFTAGKEKDEE